MKSCAGPRRAGTALFDAEMTKRTGIEVADPEKPNLPEMMVHTPKLAPCGTLRLVFRWEQHNGPMSEGRTRAGAALLCAACFSDPEGTLLTSPTNSPDINNHPLAGKHSDSPNRHPLFIISTSPLPQQLYTHYGRPRISASCACPGQTMRIHYGLRDPQARERLLSTSREGANRECRPVTALGPTLPRPKQAPAAPNADRQDPAG